MHAPSMPEIHLTVRDAHGISTMLVVLSTQLSHR